MVMREKAIERHREFAPQREGDGIQGALERERETGRRR